MERRHYPSDLMYVQWKIVQALVLRPRTVGAPQRIDRPRIINGILMLTVRAVSSVRCRTTCQSGRGSKAFRAPGCCITSGSRCTIGCVRTFVGRTGGTRLLVPPSSIAKRRKPQRSAVNAATTRTRKSRAQKGHRRRYPGPGFAVVVYPAGAQD